VARIAVESTLAISRKAIVLARFIVADTKENPAVRDGDTTIPRNDAN